MRSHQLLNRRREIIRIKRVLLEAVGRMARKHEVLVDRAAVGDVLQRFLDTEAARIGKPPGGKVIMILPR